MMQLSRYLILFLFFFILFSLKIFSQKPSNNYEKKWKKIDELITKKNLPKSALAEVKKIYQMAKKDNQDAQVIKSLVYMIGLQQETREESEAAGINEIEKEISVNKDPAVSILKSILAEMYWNYYQLHRWKLYNRTVTKDFKKEDIATWSMEDFHKKISALYFQSISKIELLQKTKLEPFEAIIIKGNTRKLRPTLYDLLAHRALDYFVNTEPDVKKPSYAFEIDQPDAFTAAADFVKVNFKTNDSLSHYHKALLVFQELLAFHMHDPNPDALLDADINRLQFVKQHSVNSDKDSLYKKALENITFNYANHPGTAQAWYLVAGLYEEQAATYQPNGDTAHRYDRLKAKGICEKVVMQNDSTSEGWVNCYNLLNEIKKKQLLFNIEKINTPGQPFRMLVNYRNFNRLYLRIIKTDEKIKSEIENSFDEHLWNTILSMKPIKSWQQELPATNDMQQHVIELKIDTLPIGDYILITSTEDDFGENATIGARLFYVSGISFINNKEDHFVLDRETGQPLADASVQVWEHTYDYKSSRYIKQKGQIYKTDKSGYFQLAAKNNQATQNYFLEISYNHDKLFMNDFLYDYYYSNNPDKILFDVEKNTTTFFFKDRSIYRPAQTVYFKGIVIVHGNDPQDNKIRAGYSTIVYLRDANYQDIDSLKVTTNEFGSFSGKFQLPQGLLNGEFNIYTKKAQGIASFHVEEYKRPKFFVDFDKIKGTYKLNEKIKVAGFAKAYAGNNIDGALIKYRVVRQPRFIYPWLFWRWWQPPAEPMEIAHGETKSDKDGKFAIEFTAIPDLKIDKKFDPIFDYRVYADVTDINGETRSGETIVSIGYKSLLLKVNIPATLLIDSLRSVSIRTENMSGEFEAAKLHVLIHKLKPENRLIRNRYWQRPDQFIMTKQEYIQNFPFDEYDNETDPKSWEKGNKVFDRIDSSINNSKFEIRNADVSSGWYSIEVETTDKDGNLVKDIQYFQLFDENNRQLSTPQYLWTQASKPIEPGEKTSIQIGSSADNVFVVQQVDKQTSNLQHRTSAYSFVSLNKEKKTFNFAATDVDRGGYGVNYFFVKNNRFFQFNDVIKIPWTNKELKIEYATFRDKTLPGSEEKWKIRITGYKSEKVAAEMLGNMYDASLDQFILHEWYKPAIWPYYSNTSYWNGLQNFTVIISQEKWKVEKDMKYLKKQYDELFTGFLRTRYDNYGRKVIADNQEVMELAAVEDSMSVSKETVGKIVGVTKDKFEEQKNLNDQKKNDAENQAIQIRRNFNETAFFFPNLQTDSTAIIEFSFTIPEALTKWKFQAIAHTKDLAFGISEKEIITQKQLMVQPNVPRFLREGDRIELSSKIVNLTDKEITGQAELQLIDATTNIAVDGWFQNVFPNQYFTLSAGQSEAIQFPIEVPYQFNKPLTWKIIARAGSFSDGEEASLPILTNRMLVTETMPLPVRGTSTKKFSFGKLLNSGESETLKNHSLTIEYASNPAWYAVQALPYLMEYPYDCAEQIWNRYYANSLAYIIANSSPRIRNIFEKWKTTDTGALFSNLQKNQELKSVLLEETPWVLEAKSEEQQKKNIALLFDLVRMSSELNSSFEKLKQMQSENGGFVWFKGGPDDRFITQYIITGIGHLKKLKGISNTQEEKLKSIFNIAIPYLDKKIKEDYDRLLRSKVNPNGQNISYTEIQYLYMRSFFPEYKIAQSSQTSYSYFQKQARQFWMKQNKYMQAMIALELYRTGDKQLPATILKSLKETSITNEELGMYWKEMTRGWFWYQAPIETQSLLIEAFQEITDDKKTVDDMRTWLLKNKQTNNWRTTKATADACYALLLNGTEWLSSEPVVEIKLGSMTISSITGGTQAGSGYFKKIIDGQSVKPDMGNITVTLAPDPSSVSEKTEGMRTSWGAVYWQYFEDLDKISVATTPLKLEKKLFVESNTDRGPVLTSVKNGDLLKVGDKIKVRIELRVDREMEYVHMKDMRASSLEPINVLSGYKWQGGLGYYETTRDASTNFFFDYLRKGTYVFEYPLFITHAGNFSNGITTIQCMYAPEFSAHSEGVRIHVEK